MPALLNFSPYWYAVFVGGVVIVILTRARIVMAWVVVLVTPFSV